MATMIAEDGPEKLRRAPVSARQLSRAKMAQFVSSEGADRMILTPDQTRLITNQKQGPMLMPRFLAEARLQLDIADLHDEVRGQVLCEHPTFNRGSASLVDGESPAARGI